MANKNTYDNALMSRPLVVLRRIDLDKLDPITFANIIGGAGIGYRRVERSLLWFRDGFILNDQPRIDMSVKEIMRATLDFAVGRPDTQTILMDGLTLKQAERAVSGAKLTLAVDVDFPEEDEPKRKAGRPPGAKNKKTLEQEALEAKYAEAEYEADEEADEE